MPTGYTLEIEKGISFNDFVLTCARAFGACIELRDSSLSPNIPEFKPDDFHLKGLMVAEKDIDKFFDMTDEEAAVLAQKEYVERVECDKAAIKKEEALKEKYFAMLNQALNWKPPTDEHNELKSFMTQQIRDSLKFDCSTGYYKRDFKLLSGKEWLETKWTNNIESIGYHKKGYLEEVVRVKKRNKWVNELKESLKQ